MLLVGLTTLLVATFFTWAVTPSVIGLARLIGAIDSPGGRRHHREPTPRIGGLAVFGGFLAGLAVAAVSTGAGVAWGQSLGSPEVGVDWRGLILAATFLLGVGLIDDLWGLSFRWKFAAQILAALAIWQWGFRIDVVSHPFQPGVLELGMLSLPLTVLWIVAITNAVNLIDGLDGLASGIALITTSAIAVIAHNGGHLGMTAASVALAGSLIGFLRYNFNPARIFLGDSGSLFLGFVLAVISVRGTQKGPTAIAVFVPLLVLGLPLLDTGLAVVRRIYGIGARGRLAGRSSIPYVVNNFTDVFLPDRGHIHHRLLEMGLSHRGTVLTLYAVGGIFSLSAFALVLLKSFWVALLLVGMLGSMLAAFILLLYVRVTRPEDVEPEADRAPIEPAAEPLPEPIPGRAEGQVPGRS